MAIFSKALSLCRPSRKISTSATRNGLITNPMKEVEELVQEPHGETVKPYAYFSLIVLIPAFSAYAWHHEYEEKFKHRERRPWPRYEFVNQKTGRLPWNNDRTLMHHPYWNFISGKGYETDKDGNKLPEGVYVSE